MDLDDEIEIINFDIEELAARHDELLRAPWEGRVCDDAQWHRTQRAVWEEIQVLREIRKELFAEREDVQR